MYRSLSGLKVHRRYDCGKEPAFECSSCSFKTHRKSNLKRHIITQHGIVSSELHVDNRRRYVNGSYEAE